MKELRTPQPYFLHNGKLQNQLLEFVTVPDHRLRAIVFQGDSPSITAHLVLLITFARDAKQILVRIPATCEFFSFRCHSQ